MRNSGDRPPEPSPEAWQAADPPERPALFVNPRSGGGAAAGEVAAQARERGITVHVLGPDTSLEALVDAAVADGADALGIAGGDGSLAVVATAAHHHGLPFVCVPAGTRNHFALDLGLDPRDPVRALDAFTDGVDRAVDLASVNGRVFLNNVSLGVYGEAVRRPTYRDAKMRTLFEAALTVLGPSTPPSGLRLLDERGKEHRDPAVVLVSNNPYALDRPPAQAARPSLESGQLGILLLDAPAPGTSPGPYAWAATSLEVQASATVHAGIDGEAADVEPPLSFAILPSALRVRITRPTRSSRR